MCVWLRGKIQKMCVFTVIWGKTKCRGKTKFHYTPNTFNATTTWVFVKRYQFDSCYSVTHYEIHYCQNYCSKFFSALNNVTFPPLKLTKICVFYEYDACAPMIHYILYIIRVRRKHKNEQLIGAIFFTW